mgnify:CR=1 FL=1
MAYSPTKHDLPPALIAADEALSADVNRRSWEALQWLWQVTTGTADAGGSALTAPQGHTHDGIRDQSLGADSSVILGYPCGHGSTMLETMSAASPTPADPIFDPGGRWTNGAAFGAVEVCQSIATVPFAVAPAPPMTSAAVTAYVLVEHGAANPAGNVTVIVTLGGVANVQVNAMAAIGLEMFTVGPWAVGALPMGGPNALAVTIISANSAEKARGWSCVVVPS